MKKNNDYSPFVLPVKEQIRWSGLPATKWNPGFGMIYRLWRRLIILADFREDSNRENIGIPIGLIMPLRN